MNEQAVNANQQSIDPMYLQQRLCEASGVYTACEAYRRNLHFVNLRPLSPEAYYDSMKKWDEFEAFREPKRKCIDKEVGITWYMKLKSFLDEDTKKDLLNKKKQAAIQYQQEVQRAHELHSQRAKRFYERQKQKNLEVDQLHQKMINGDAMQIESYFHSVLLQDNYSTDCQTPYCTCIEDVCYDTITKKLSYAYQVPLQEEILTFESFEYDATQDRISPTTPKKQDALSQRTDVLRKILLRSIILIYSSDTYGLINDVEVTGFWFYFDLSYGKNRRKDIINLHMSTADYHETNFAQVDVTSLFKMRVKPKESPGIYSKSPVEIVDIYSMKETTSSSKKKAK